jgi:hypothetical protein
VKVLFDHNVHFGLRRALEGHEVFLADEMGWAEISNGILLRLPEEAGFELMITCAQNLSYQQNLKGRKLALIVLDTNNWKVLKGSLRRIVGAVERATPGNFEFLAIRD